MQLPDHSCTVCMWLDFPLDPDTASESLSQRSKPAQHQSIRTDTDVFTCKNRPVHSQCMRQRSKAQKGEDTCLKAHSKLGTEQGTEPRALLPPLQAEHLQERNSCPCAGVCSPQLPALPTHSPFPSPCPGIVSTPRPCFPANEEARNQAIRGTVQRNGSVQTPVGCHHG